MGDKTYIGKPCKHGHGVVRYTANGTCVVCNATKSKESAKNRVKKSSRYFGKVCIKHPESHGERMSSSSTCVKCLAERSAALQKKNGYPVMQRQIEKITRAVFEHYGAECTICGINDPDVLTIDHVNQDGAKHLQNNGERYRGIRLYRWLINSGFPEEFRTLCFNCNIKAYREHLRKKGK